MQHCVVTESLGQILLRAGTFTMGDCWESNGSNWAAFDMYVAHKGTSKLLLNSKPQNWDRKRRGQHATRRMKFRVGQDNCQWSDMYCTQYFEYYMYIFDSWYVSTSSKDFWQHWFWLPLTLFFCYITFILCFFLHLMEWLLQKKVPSERGEQNTKKKIVEMLLDSTIDLATEMWSCPSMHCSQIRKI